MQIWENDNIQILESGFQQHSSESFFSKSISGLGERNLYFLQAFLSVATASHDSTTTQSDEALVDDDEEGGEEGGGGGGGGGRPHNGLSCDFAVQVDREVIKTNDMRHTGKQPG